MTDSMVQTPDDRNRELAKMEPTNFMVRMAKEMGVSVDNVKTTIRDMCLPPTSSNGEFLALMIVASQYNLNPLLGEIYAMKGKNGKIVPILGKNCFEKVASKHPTYLGHNFRYVYNIDGKPQETEFPIDGYPLMSIGCVMQRSDRPFAETSWAKLSEYNRPNIDTWKNYPTTMLEHKAFIKAAKKSLGIGDLYDADEAARFVKYDPSVSAAKQDAALFGVIPPAAPTKSSPMLQPAEVEVQAPRFVNDTPEIESQSENLNGPPTQSALFDCDDAEFVFPEHDPEKTESANLREAQGAVLKKAEAFNANLAVITQELYGKTVKPSQLSIEKCREVFDKIKE